MTVRVVAILGPTASGKAELSLAAAEATGAVLVSCDSMKVYRGLDVGTAKPPPAERGRWLGLDLVDPHERFDARRFRALVDGALERARAESRPVLLSGGTMLYLKAATEGLATTPPRDEAVREQLAREAEAQGSAALHARLATVDPAAAARVHPNDLRRVVRALEVHALTGRALSDLHAEEGGKLGTLREGITRAVLVVHREREDLDRRIDARVVRMLDAGWVEECRRLLALEPPPSIEATQAIGYPELLSWLRGSPPAGARPPRDVVVKIQTATRRFARRQLTWLKHVHDAELLEVPAGGDALAHLPRVVAALRA